MVFDLEGPLLHAEALEALRFAHAASVRPDLDETELASSYRESLDRPRREARIVPSEQFGLERPQETGRPGHRPPGSYPPILTSAPMTKRWRIQPPSCSIATRATPPWSVSYAAAAALRRCVWTFRDGRPSAETTLAAGMRSAAFTTPPTRRRFRGSAGLLEHGRAADDSHALCEVVRPAYAGVH